MGSIAGSISGVEKQLEEQTALHLEFEQRKVSRTVKRRKEDLCDSDVSNFKLAKKNVFHWSGEGECKSELMMRNITLTEKPPRLGIPANAESLHLHLPLPMQTALVPKGTN